MTADVRCDRLQQARLVKQLRPGLGDRAVHRILRWVASQHLLEPLPRIDRRTIGSGAQIGATQYRQLANPRPRIGRESRRQSAFTSFDDSPSVIGD
jgi:hypothetical protein